MTDHMRKRVDRVERGNRSEGRWSLKQVERIWDGRVIMAIDRVGEKKWRRRRRWGGWFGRFVGAHVTAGTARPRLSPRRASQAGRNVRYRSAAARRAPARHWTEGAGRVQLVG